VESCASALGLSIQTVDRSVHVKREFEIPVHAVDMADEERKALLADMFYRDAMPAIIFTTGIETHRCDDDANMERSACKKQEGRRRAQLARDRSCPHSTFLTKGASMLAACGLELGATELPSTCPSTNCAQQLLSLLDDCTDSLEHAASMEAELYTALAAGVFYASCAELEAQSSMFATVQVEFRAPSQLVADRLILEHAELATNMATVFTEGCADQSGNACTGRRRLEEQQAADEIVALREQLRLATVENNALLSMVAEQQATLTACDAGAAEPQVPRRRQQAKTAHVDVLAAVHTADGAVKACAASPCEIGEVCENGGVCALGSVVESSGQPPTTPDGASAGGGHRRQLGEAVGDLATTFTCACLAGFSGPRCGDAAPGAPAGDHGR
jgi:hypothetical protein